MGEKKDKLFKENQNFKTKFGFLITEHRMIKDLTQEQLGEIVNLADNTIGETERGNRNCHVYNFYLMIHALNIPKEVVIDFLYNPSYLPELVLDKLNQTKNEVNN